MYDYDELKMAVMTSGMDTKYRMELVDILEKLKGDDEELPIVGDVIMIDGDGSTYLVVYEDVKNYILYRFLSQTFFIFSKSEMKATYEKTVTHRDPSSILKERI